MSRDLLIELGTEELPPKALPTLSAALTEEFVRQLDEAGLNHGEVESFAAPRRLACWCVAWMTSRRIGISNARALPFRLPSTRTVTPPRRRKGLRPLWD